MSTKTRRQWTGPLVWDRNNIGSDDRWIIQINETELEEIYQAVLTTLLSDKPIGELDRRDFDFKTFGERLTTVQNELLFGQGFILIRGLPAEGWSDEELIRAYWGIGQWIGVPVSQNAKAHLLGHVIDQRAADSKDSRIYQTNRAQPFHSDSCDTVGLLCLRTAKQGGASSVASSAAIHNKLLETHPELLEQLYGEFHCDRYGEIPAGKQPYYPVSVFNEVDKQLVCCGMDPDIRSAQRLDSVAPLSDKQLQALDIFQETARELSIEMHLQRGDIQLINNLIAVHAREQFTDHDEPSERRYLIRLWLSAHNGRALPSFLSERWGNIEVGRVRGGIRVPGSTPVVHLDPNA